MNIRIKGIAFTGYPVTNVPRAREFYEETLGLVATLAHEIQPGVWWVEYEPGAGTFAISNAWAPSGQSGPSIAFEVEDIQAALAQLKERGARITTDLIETPVCRFFSTADPDGNEITIHQLKAGA